MIEINKFRHTKEKSYYMVAAIIGGLCWAGLILGTLGIALLFIGMMAVPLWLTQQFFKASIYGHAVKVSDRQYADLNKMVKESAKALGLEKVPDVFIVQGNGALNALAVKFLSGQYVLLYSELVDLMIQKRQMLELKMIIAHELAHHAAGHTDWKKNLLIMPATYIPYVGMAYSRACEFTADRLGAAAVGDLEAAKRALVTLAAGSTVLRTDIDAFTAQENEIPGIFGYINEIYSSHPRMTRRILELDTLAGMLPKRRPTAQLAQGQQSRVASAPLPAYEEAEG